VTDLHFSDERATATEAAAVDAVLIDAGVGPAVVVEDERLVRGGVHRRNERRHLLLPCLHALQRAAGWISPGGLNHACDVLAVPPAEAYGVATFYDLFRVDDPGHSDDVVHVCVDAACQIANAEERVSTLEAEGKRVHRSPCLGQCERPVALFVQGRAKADRVPADAAVDSGQIPQLHDPSLKLLGRIGRHDPKSLDAYVAGGGYTALAKAFALGAPGVVEEVAVSGLMGRGGAAFPTGVKWRGVAAEPGVEAGVQKYVVANADESEPGTFKDRIVMENDPFALVEALTIAGFGVGATKGWIYVRGEYPLATDRLQNAIVQARAAGFLGTGIAGSSFDFDIEIRRGAGAYICGEETALFNSLEGFRGEPRQKPPFPTTHGLFKRPTAINNPETLLNVLDIVTIGGEAYAATGTDGSNGQKLFCVSGHVASPGIYEVEFGPTLGDLIAMAGGVTGTLRSVLLGGAAGSFVGPEALDMPLTFEGVRERGVSLGSGVIMAFNDTVDFPAVVTRIAQFFRDESCGQCVPCRVGAVRQHELLVRTETKVGPPELKLLSDMDLAMKDASICGLGHTASTAVRSAIDLGLIGANHSGESDPGDANVGETE
jgi:NADH-quinone oxidoreductase subunit F